MRNADTCRTVSAFEQAHRARTATGLTNRICFRAQSMRSPARSLVTTKWIKFAGSFDCLLWPKQIRSTSDTIAFSARKMAEILARPKLLGRDFRANLRARKSSPKFCLRSRPNTIGRSFGHSAACFNALELDSSLSTLRWLPFLTAPKFALVS